MDFFDRQEASQRATRRLVLLFGLAFLAVALATGLALLLALGFATNGTATAITAPSFTQLLIASADKLALFVAIVMGLMIIASLFRAATLSQGGGHVARMLGGTQIQPDDQDPLHRRLINVVEEMALASGLPVPEIYVLEAERGINAFAAGLTPDDAAVAVTRGSLEQLSRAELQGVIAHEFSHILNGDMRLNLRLMGFSFGILVLSLVGRWLLRASSRGIRFSGRNKGSPAIFIGLALTIIGAIGVLLSRLIKAAVSRQRERLADASAVQFTREPMALAGALKKIGGFTPYIEKVETEEVSHMLFGKAGRSFSGWFATHPPLDERIRALDPAFESGDYIAPSQHAEGGEHGAANLAGASGAASVSAEPLGLDRAGTLDVVAGTQLRQSMPANVVDAAHSSQSSWLLVLALGLERNGGTSQERSLLETQLGSQRAAQCFALRAELDMMDPGLLLPLFDMAVPALKARPPEQIQYLFELLDRLIAADGKVTLFEFLLQQNLQAHLLPAEHAAAGKAARAEAQMLLLAFVAARGHSDPAATGAAYAAGLAAAELDPAPAATILERALAATTFDELERALKQLASASAADRRAVLKALAVTMRHDRRIEVIEAELFRTIAAVLGCPVPPMHVIS